MCIYKKCEFLIVSSRQRQKGAFTSSKKLTPSVSIYYELVGIPIRYAARYYFCACIPVKFLTL